MSTPTNPSREHPSTYFVQDRESKEELERLRVFDDLLTAGMGGVLPEQPDPVGFQRVLDVGCGTGGWLSEAARTYPGMSRLVGVDVSHKFVEYARKETEVAQASDRVEFREGDALRMLEFPADSFDLVNHRAASSWLRKWDWPKLLLEYQRVSRPEGVIRITEPAWIVESNSPALTQLYELFLQAGYQAGHLFSPASDSVTGELAHLLYQHGLQQVQTRSYALEYRAGTIEGHYYVETIRLFFRTILPFLRKWSRVPEDYGTLYHRMLSEIQQPDFVATWSLLTAWGRKPPRKENPAPISAAL
jgi:ubiquinone/menaquinone biosynthesis C-methylase UbiE